MTRKDMSRHTCGGDVERESCLACARRHDLRPDALVLVARDEQTFWSDADRGLTSEQIYAARSRRRRAAYAESQSAKRLAATRRDGGTQ